VVVYATLAAWGTFRRIWQVLRVDVAPSSTVLVPGSMVSIDVVTTGEVRNRILLELVQGSRARTLLDFQSRLSAVNTLDPRLFRYTPSVAITPDVLSQFDAGAATLRLTGFGGSKLLRVPPPRTREVSVQLGPPTR
jgi:hypothetical protein